MNTRRRRSSNVEVVQAKTTGDYKELGATGTGQRADAAIMPGV